MPEVYVQHIVIVVQNMVYVPVLLHKAFFQGRRTNEQGLGPEEQTCFQGVGHALVLLRRNNSKAVPASWSSF